MFTVYYYTTASGKNPVKELIQDQDKHAREKMYAVIGYFEKAGFHLDTQYLRRMSGTSALWELRSHYGSIHYRFFFARLNDHAVVLLHAIIKKTPKTPRKEVQTAERRWQEVVQSMKGDL